MLMTVLSNSRRLLAVSGLCLALWGPAQADPITLSTPTLIATPGGVGLSFDVSLDNPGAAFNLGSFALEISTTYTKITFEESTTVTVAPYVFAGDSFDNTFLTGVSSTSSPGQTLQAFDATADAGNVLVPANSTVGLAHVIFNVSPGAAPGTTATIAFDLSGGNSLSQANFTPITIDGFQDGAIDVVPEPSTTLLFATGLAWLMVRRARRRPAVQ